MENIAGIFMNMSLSMLWLILLVLFLIIEAAIPGLVSIWFALGALAALILSLCKAGFAVQLIVFILVSIISLAATRPLAKKYVDSKTQATNLDMIIGHNCVVTETINNLASSGAVSVSGKVWTARTARDGIVIPEGNVVRAVRIDGVKLIVETVQ